MSQPHGRIRVNKVARATQQHNLERKAVADTFEGDLGYSDCKYGILELLHYGITPSLSQRLRVGLATGS